MGDLTFLSGLLAKVSEHSTVVGKVWMTVLFLFRIMVLGASIESVWGDERSNMVCDTTRTGCESMCYNWMFPISHVRFWVLQIIFVSVPTLLYLGHAMHVISKERKLREQLKKDEASLVVKRPKYTDESGKVYIRGVLLRTYMAQLFFKILLEVGFILGQYYLYGFFMMREFDCKQYPCTKTAQCFVSRPTEKTVYIIFQLVVACFSVFLCILEGFYLLCKNMKSRSSPTIHHHQPLLSPAPGSGTTTPLPHWQPHMVAMETIHQNNTNASYEGEKRL
ncbi:gap junction Cx32.2 protein-like [Engraulis encrasicolus]|uniref:gap junction Cx32.2 protein-like n=1 Tax=Engraulis encrasicolus TaxID=184585 RepID=UPI002FD05FE8